MGYIMILFIFCVIYGLWALDAGSVRFSHWDDDLRFGFLSVIALISLCIVAFALLGARP